jgi:ABC-2 type transport system permease protein
MKKFWAILRISFQQDFAYRSKFVVLRLRNILGVFLVFFLWDSVFSDPGKQVFGYDRTKILTYVLGVLIVRSVVLSAHSFDVAGEIASGDVTNCLLKPLNYLWYCFLRDVSNKSLHVVFSVVEIAVLFFLLKPPFLVQTNYVYFGGFVLSLALAIVLFFLILIITALVAFWMPEAIWPVQFLFISIIAELLSGSVFPLDVFPRSMQNVLYLTPFPYLIFFPLQVYLGKLAIGEILKGLLVEGFWLGGLYLFLMRVWRAGLAAYRAEGR